MIWSDISFWGAKFVTPKERDKEKPSTEMTIKQQSCPNRYNEQDNSNDLIIICSSSN